MNDPRVDPEAAAEFLQWWRPGGPWVLAAIDAGGADKDPVVRTFTDAEAVRDWVRAKESSNQYFMVNPATRSLSKKASRRDVLALSWLHVDVDPKGLAGGTADEKRDHLAREQERILQAVSDPPGTIPDPTCVIFSGGGYQAFWRLEQPVPVDGELALAEEAKLYNLHLEVAFGADPCHNVDRIMRLPGTVNWPNAKKRAVGREPQVARVVSRREDALPISCFSKAAKVSGETHGFVGETIDLGGNAPRVADLSELPAQVADRTKVVIAQGHDPDDSDRHPSRSEWLFSVCCDLVRAGLEDEQIFGIITDPTWRISASVLDKKGRAASYAARQIERAREEAVDPWLRRLNERHAVIGDIGGRCRIASRVPDPVTGRSRVSLQSFADFRNRYCHVHVEFQGGNGNPVRIPVGKWWTTHPQRRQYETMVFAPGQYKLQGAYNLWEGFAYESRPGDCSLFLEHVRTNVCGGCEDSYRYLLGWMARAVQEPQKPGYTAVVLRGRQGTGKSFFARHFGKLFGQHFVQVSDPKHMVGSFNAHLASCLVLFADEAFFAGDKRHEGVLKSLVTEETIMIEYKGVDATPARNHTHVVMASNERWVVPADVDDRRFFVLDVADEQMQKGEYFAGIARQLDDGGYAALLDYLMAWDLSGFDVAAFPRTAALREQKVLSMAPEEEWWYAKLQAGEVFEGGGWPQHVFASHLVHDWTQNLTRWRMNSVRSNSTRLGLFVRRALPGGAGLRKQLAGSHEVIDEQGRLVTTARPRVYQMPPLEECRRHWDEHFGGPFEWPGGEEAVANPNPAPF